MVPVTFIGSTNESIFTGEEYATREDAIQHIPEEFGLAPGDHFYVGVASPITEIPCPPIDWEAVYDLLEVPWDLLEGWPEFTPDEEDDLQQHMSAALTDWLRRHNRMPPVGYRVNHVTKHHAP